MEEKKTLKEIIREAGIEGDFACDLCESLYGFGCTKRDHGGRDENCDEDLANELIKAIDREYIERPRFEDGGLVRIGDEYQNRIGKTHKVVTCEIDINGGFELYGDNGVAVDSTGFQPGERVKRPKPQAIGADGKPIKVGDTVYGIENGIEFRVTAVYADMETNNVTARSANEYGQAGYCNLKAKTLTHEQPDTLERIEDDATMSPLVYCEDIMELPHCREEFDQATLIELMVADLLARQRKVLERGQR